MRYVVSDIHGCYDEFKELLALIHFSENDEMYILGDMVDRGPKPIALLKDLMGRYNIYPVLGNHDYMALKILKKMNVLITEENAEHHLTQEDMTGYLYWIQDGGDMTAKQFSKLDEWDKEDILDYLSEAVLYEQVRVGEKLYILVHAGLEHFEEGKPLSEYNLSDLIFSSPDYEKRLFSDENIYLVTGHRPTLSIPGHEKPEIYCKNGHIAIDCGCVFGGRLAAFCLETEEEFYVDCKSDSKRYSGSDEE